MSTTIERERFLRVVSMNANAAKAYGMPDAAHVVCAGQADAQLYRFGARVYFLFQTWSDYQAWIAEGKPGLSAA